MPPIGIGEKNGQSKLNENKVMDILSLLKDKKLTLKEIGVRFGVSDQCIYRISSGKAWRHVTA
jgi:DNA-directed RNA polymerase specialized sigma subunit